MLSNQTRGGEYEKLNSFFQKVGITHLVFCPHAHQQNGAAKRKHRHIIEVGLSLLSHASMPLKFWDEAFLAATYLINRTPSKIINFSTPLERLFNETPDYSMLRTFGCACWPNLCPYNSRKLEFRSKRCAFFGYNNLHKGYKCLDISTGRVYISRDVVFDEQVFPFSTLHANAGAQLRAEINLLSPDLLSTHTLPRSTTLHPTDSVICSAPYAQNPVENSAVEGDFMQGNGHTGTEEDPGGAATTLAPIASGSVPTTAADQAPTPVASSVHDLAVAGVHNDGVTTSPAMTGSSLGSPPMVDGSDVQGPSSGSPPTPGEQRRPRTRAQDGIYKPKVYTDGTVR